MAPDSEAERLYDTFGAQLYRYALMILANHQAAEDVIQQIFMTILDRRTGRLENEERYLRRAVRNACYSVLRRQSVRRGPSLDDVLLEPVAEGPVVSDEDRLTLSAAIRQLPADQREVIHLHVFEGRTFKEVSELTGDSLNTVASRYRYAIDKLKQAFDS